MTGPGGRPDLARIERRLLERRGRREGREIRFLCPAHEDRHPSARWNGDKRAWYCDACRQGGGWRDLCRRLGIESAATGEPAPGAGGDPARDAGTDPARDQRGAAAAPWTARGPRGAVAAAHPYTDLDGKLLYEILRLRPKAFRCRRPDGAGGWHWNLQGAARVLYRLPEIAAAVARDELILFVEGEKDADALAALGFTATTHAGGAGRWRPEYARPLRGARVLVLPDNDEPGRRHAQAVIAGLSRQAAAVRALELPGLPAKGDVSDWIAARRGEGLAEVQIRCRLLDLAVQALAPGAAAGDRPDATAASDARTEKPGRSGNASASPAVAPGGGEPPTASGAAAARRRRAGGPAAAGAAPTESRPEDDPGDTRSPVVVPAEDEVDAPVALPFPSPSQLACASDLRPPSDARATTPFESGRPGGPAEGGGAVAASVGDEAAAVALASPLPSQPARAKVRPSCDALAAAAAAHGTAMERGAAAPPPGEVAEACSASGAMSGRAASGGGAGGAPEVREDGAIAAEGAAGVAGVTDDGARPGAARDAGIATVAAAGAVTAPIAGAARTAAPAAWKGLVRCLAEISPQAVSFLWQPYLPVGKLTLLEGDPGQGKSWLAAAIAAAGSRGHGLPGVPAFPPFRTLFLTAEDGLLDTLRPRLDSMAADCAAIFACDRPLALDVESDLGTLAQVLRAFRPGLVVVDPLVAFLGRATDIYRANEVRSVLAPLIKLIEQHCCALLAVRHLNKAKQGRTIYAGQGSIDFTAAARSVLLAGSAAEDGTAHALVHIKSNLAPHGPTLGYRLLPAFRWEGTSRLTAGDLLAAAAPADEASAEDEARAFLRSALGGSEPLPARLVLHAAREAGISQRTLKRAKRREGVRATRQGFGAGSTWLWSLPEAEPETEHPGAGERPRAGEEGQGTEEVHIQTWPPSSKGGLNRGADQAREGREGHTDTEPSAGVAGDAAQHTCEPSTFPDDPDLDEPPSPETRALLL
jgi:AAA domain